MPANQQQVTIKPERYHTDISQAFIIPHLNYKTMSSLLVTDRLKLRNPRKPNLLLYITIFFSTGYYYIFYEIIRQ